MMFGHVETLAERIEHLERLRQLQDETGGFTAFICWTFQPEHTDMADIPPAGVVRVSEDERGGAAVSRQLRQHPIELGDAGTEDRPAGPAVRRERHGQPDDRGERRGRGGHGAPSCRSTRFAARSRNWATCRGNGTCIIELIDAEHEQRAIEANHARYEQIRAAQRQRERSCAAEHARAAFDCAGRQYGLSGKLPRKRLIFRPFSLPRLAAIS